MQETIELRKKREFGEVFNATTIFIKQEFKVLGKAFLYYVLPVSIVIGIMSALNQARMLNSIGDMSNSGTLGFNAGSFIKRYLLTYLIYLIQQTILISFTYSYIKLYLIHGSGNFSIRMVYDKMASSLVSMFVACLTVFAVTVAGTIFCIIPGIYLGIVLCVIFSIMFFEDKGLGEAFSRSFELTRNQWWPTFLLVFVSMLLCALISYILLLPMSIYGLTVAMHSMREPGSLAIHMNPFVVIYTCLMTIISSVIYVIPHIVIAFQYFNIVELKERPSLLDKIDQIANDDLPKTE